MEEGQVERHWADFQAIGQEAEPQRILMVDPSNHNLVVAKANPDAFAGAIDRAVDNAGLRRSVGDANRARCESEYDKHARYRAWVDLYDSLLS